MALEALPRSRYKDQGLWRVCKTHLNGVQVQFSHYAEALPPAKAPCFMERMM